jgi:hypothetical protein|uniref:Uncharacterized protein n=1 Tax=viral metagenome TaxID=1070528 RepID=A0A6C0ITD1_9ZZZZ
MNDNIIYLIIIAIVYLMYQNIFCNTTERFSENKQTIDQQVKEQIGKIYKADIQSIRNLSDISKKLQEGTLTVPGDITIEGNINMKDGKSIKSTGVLKIVPKKGTLFAKDDGSTGNIDIKGSIVGTTIDGINNNINKTNNKLNNRIIDIKKTHCDTTRVLYALKKGKKDSYDRNWRTNRPSSYERALDTPWSIRKEKMCKQKVDRENK